jgi:hypothetical protein
MATIAASDGRWGMALSRRLAVDSGRAAKVAMVLGDVPARRNPATDNQVGNSCSA